MVSSSEMFRAVLNAAAFLVSPPTQEAHNQFLATFSPLLFAQSKEPNSPTARNTVGTTAEGKILWQYNTDG